jgi:dTDP-4-dehydrorhamnose 3,5-epimerase
METLGPTPTLTPKRKETALANGLAGRGDIGSERKKTVRLIDARRFVDDRGWFSETFHRDRLAALGITDTFVQDNHSMSLAAGTLRGIHFQTPPYAQAKLVRCLSGRIWDVAVDLRGGSSTFGKWVGAELTAENGRQLYIPVGFGHAFITLAPNTEVAYKVSDFYSPQADGGIRWNDPDLAVEWQFGPEAIKLSPKDERLPLLADFDSPFPFDGVPLERLAS